MTLLFQEFENERILPSKGVKENDQTKATKLFLFFDSYQFTVMHGVFYNSLILDKKGNSV
ncbi:MAG TPA: hypothetical protein DHV83_05945 [Prevotella sp.]|nr:hypothetical protein [Prevotella sp.]